MPRPGPRPYECVRRAWHSDSHQPLRGSLTQDIFRVVTDLHAVETRKKKEWQEKLPTVVLRAEEILYSKARSEEEYTDLQTLKERLEDAVNTMIRRTDNSKANSKEGPYMEPCVEAALSLGCAPKSVPRGQRSGPRHSIVHSKRTSNLTSASSSNSIATQTQQSSLRFSAAFQEHTKVDMQRLLSKNAYTWPGDTIPGGQMHSEGPSASHVLDGRGLTLESSKVNSILDPNNFSFGPCSLARLPSFATISNEMQCPIKEHAPALKTAQREIAYCLQKNADCYGACSTTGIQPILYYGQRPNYEQFQMPAHWSLHATTQPSVSKIISGAERAERASELPRSCNSSCLGSNTSQFTVASNSGAMLSTLLSYRHGGLDTKASARSLSQMEHVGSGPSISSADDLQLRLGPPGMELSRSDFGASRTTHSMDVNPSVDVPVTKRQKFVMHQNHGSAEVSDLKDSLQTKAYWSVGELL